MATLTKLHAYPEVRPGIRKKDLNLSSIQVMGHRNRSRKSYGFHRKICRSFKEGDEIVEVEKERDGGDVIKVNDGGKRFGPLKSAILEICKWPTYSGHECKAKLAELEEVLSAIALQIGRYIVTMMSTGVVLLVGFQLSGGESQMNNLIWYSWLGGIIIGTMVGSNMVLDEHSRAGPRNVVITGSTRGLGKALAREFLLSGDRVVVTSRRLSSGESEFITAFAI